MIRAVIFDMFETLITHYQSPLYFGAQMAEEAKVIRGSELFPYFDAIYLSYEQGIKKPDEEIFKRCMTQLSVNAEECLYVGDGGSYELETAKRLGMTAAQAVWYLKEGTSQPTGRKLDFVQLETPLDVLNYTEQTKRHTSALEE